MTRSRRLIISTAATSVVAVAAAFGGGTTLHSAASTAPAVQFTSTPGTATLLAHYEVTPTGTATPTSTGPANEQDARPDLVLKRPHATRGAARPSDATAPRSDNTLAETRGNDDNVPAPSASFKGQQGSNTTCPYFAKGCNPPDMALAASPGFVLQGVNMQWEVHTPSGAVVPGWPVGAQQFFGVPNVTNADGTPCDVAHHSQPFLSDPRALYDPVSGRFWAAMLQAEGSLGIAADCPEKTVYYIAVSQTRDPSRAWNVYEFDMSLGTTNVADYTQIGLNGDALFFSANMFTQDGSAYAYAEIFEANKAQMERGGARFTAAGFFNLQGTGPGTTAATGPFVADTVQPVNDLDRASSRDRAAANQDGDGGGDNGGNGHGDGLFVDTIDGPDLVNGHFCTSAADACHGLALWRMANPVAHDRGGPAPTLTGTYIANTKPFYVPPASDQPSCNRCVDSNDLRIPATPVLQNGVISTGWGTGLDNGTQVVPGIEWAQVRVTDASASTGYFNFSGDAAATYPAFMPDRSGNVLMVYEYMSHTVNPEVRYTLRNQGEANFVRPGRTLKKGEASYRPSLCGGAIPVCRWGDYEATSIDQNGRVWFAGEYANSHTDPGASPTFGRNWGTWIGSVSQDQNQGD